MRGLVIVPAFNEADNIAVVIDSLRGAEHGFEFDVMVVDDCSKDGTARVAAASGKAIVVSLVNNLGVGGAVQAGLKYAMREGYSLAVKFDGDGQHIASEIRKITAPIITGEADVVIGSRFCEDRPNFKSTFLRRFGIRIISAVSSLLTEQAITDSTSGFRAYGRRAIEFLAPNYPSFDYPEPEEVILLGKNGFSIREVFVQMRERQGGKSSISGLKTLYFMFKVLLAVCMTAMRAPLTNTK